MGNMIRVEDNDGVATVRLAHGKVGALGIEFGHVITETMRAYADVKAIVLTGTGTALSRW